MAAFRVSRKLLLRKTLDTSLFGGSSIGSALQWGIKGGGAPYSSSSSWRGDSAAEMGGNDLYLRYGRSKVGRWGDWACVGLAVLLGGVLWTEETSSEKLQKKRERTRLFLESKQRKLMQMEEILQTFIDNAVDDLDALDVYLQRLDGIQPELHSHRGEPFQNLAIAMLQRIEMCKMTLSSQPVELASTSPEPSPYDVKKKEECIKLLSKCQELVKVLMKVHADNEEALAAVKDMKADVDKLLLKLKE